MQWLPPNEALQGADIAFALILVAIVLLLGSFIYLERKLNRFLVDRNAKNIGETLSLLSQAREAHEVFENEMENYLTLAEERLRSTIRGVGVVRFNPFRGSGSGGNQSFAVALINEKGDGVILSSLYSRDHVSVYAKPVVDFSSEFDLTLEEREAIKKAKEGLTVKRAQS